MTQKEINTAAIAIKEYLVDLAINDELPLDMNELPVTDLVNVIKKAVK